MNAIERDQPGGSRSCATESIAQPAPLSPGGSQCSATLDARQRVPPARRHPSRNSVMMFHDNRSTLLYVTVVTEKRMPVLVDEDARQHVPPEDEREGRAAARPKTAIDCILAAWEAATDWLVGRYVIMPDHIHFFCAPASYPPSDFHRWMAYWKFLSTKEYWRLMGGSRCCTTEPIAQPAPLSPGGSQCPATLDAQQRVPPRNPPLWQRDCWDRQLRTGESYSQKWEYVRNNPVRKGLVTCADDWPYQGELNVLEWHERN